jgi:hypothetical protein
MKLKFRIGDWIVMPLPDGTRTVGHVERRDAWAFLGYFFGPRRLAMPIFDLISTELLVSDGPSSRRE